MSVIDSLMASVFGPAQIVDCEGYSEESLIDAWMNGEWFNAVACPYDAQLGSITVGLIVYSTLMIGLYVKTQSFVIPITVSMLIGTVVVSRLPSRALQIMGLSILLVITFAMYLLYQRVQTVT